MTDTIRSLTLMSDLNEMDRVADFVRQLASGIGCDAETEHRIMLSLTEAVTNAIIHGNKYDLSKKINISTSHDDNNLTVTISDEGQGFDPDSIPDPRKSENLLSPGGRGVWLMREYADEVKFSNKGSNVQLLFRLDD